MMLVPSDLESIGYKNINPTQPCLYSKDICSIELYVDSFIIIRSLIGTKVKYAYPLWLIQFSGKIYNVDQLKEKLIELNLDKELYRDYKLEKLLCKD